MNHLRPIALMLLPVFAAWPADADDLTAGDVIEMLKANPIPESYRADMRVEMNSAGMPLNMDGTIAVHQGAMRMESTMTMNGQPATTTVVMGPDGMQWIETHLAAMDLTQVMKMDMSVLKESAGDLPGMNMMGPGGGPNFRPTPEMYDTWQETMDLTYEGTETVGGQETYVLSGTYKDEYVEQLDPKGSMRAMNTLPDRMIFYVAKETSFPVRVTMESAQGVNGMITLSNVDLNPEFDEGAFSYTPPAGVIPVDMTEMLRQQLNVMRGQDGAPSDSDQ